MEKPKITDAEFEEKRWRDPGDWPKKLPPQPRYAKFKIVRKPPKVKDDRRWWQDRYITFDWRHALMMAAISGVTVLSHLGRQ